MFIAQLLLRTLILKTHFILQLPTPNVYYLSRIIVNLGTHYMYDIFLLHHLFGLENEPQVYIHFLIFYRISLVRRAKKVWSQPIFSQYFPSFKKFMFVFYHSQIANHITSEKKNWKKNLLFEVRKKLFGIQIPSNKQFCIIRAT